MVKVIGIHTRGEPKMFNIDTFVMPSPIPSLFKKDPRTKLAIPEINPECDWVRQGQGLVTIMIDGIHVKVKKDPSTGKSRVYRRLKGYTGSNSAYIQVYEHDNLDKPIWDAFNILISKDPGIYVVYGPDVKGNPQGADNNYMIRVAPVSGVLIVPQNNELKIQRGPSVLTQELYDSIRLELTNSDVKGIVFQIENPSMCPILFSKVTRKDFGLPWPIKPPQKLIAYSSAIN